MYGTTLNRETSLLILSILLMASQQAAAQAGQLVRRSGRAGSLPPTLPKTILRRSTTQWRFRVTAKSYSVEQPNGPALLRLNTNGTLDPRASVRAAS